MTCNYDSAALEGELIITSETIESLTVTSDPTIVGESGSLTIEVVLKTSVTETSVTADIELPDDWYTSLLTDSSALVSCINDLFLIRMMPLRVN